MPRDTVEESVEVEDVDKNRPSDKTIVSIARKIIKQDNEIEEVRDSLKSLVGARRAMVKDAKKKGINTAALLQVIRELKLDPAEVAREWEEHQRITRLLNVPLGTQFDLWMAEREPDAEPSEEAQAQAKFNAEQDGYLAGKEGHKIDANPHHQSTASALFSAWRKGWNRGQAHLAKGLTPAKQKVTKAPTEVRQRRKPNGHGEVLPAAE
jgi:hypothetical protein